MEEAKKATDPDLVYCGTLLRGSKKALKMLYHSFDLNLLKTGQQPAALSACFFKTAVFERLGKFNSRYPGRGDYEFFCRLAKQNVSVFSIRRYLIDHEVKSISKGVMLRYLRETAEIIYCLFGMRALLQWLCQEKGENMAF